MLPKIGIRPIIDGRWGGIRESLEEQTMNMAKAAAKLITENLKHPNGEPIECVIADSTIGGVKEATDCERKFSTKNVVATLSVTPCWCYGTETMDLNPLTIKGVWGFNGTERPGAVYLMAAMAGHAQKGLPAFAIYGKDVQDAGDTNVPEDVKDKILNFAKSAISVGSMFNKSYVNIGGACMGIAGSMCDDNFFQQYLGIRTEYVDMSEIIRRIELEIYDKDEFDKAMKWVKENTEEGIDPNKNPFTREEKDGQWEFVVKHALICKDILQGNEKLKDMGNPEESFGRNAIAGGFQGQRQWTDFKPDGDFTEAMLASSFDWNGKRQPLLLATENDTLNGVSMIFGNLLTNKSPIFADVRTYWSPESVKRVTGHELTGKSANGFIHLINSGAAALDGAGVMKDSEGNSTMKEWWNVTDEDIKNTLDYVKWSPGDRDYFRGGGFSSSFSTQGEMPVTLIRVNIIDGLGPVLQLAEGYTVELPEDVNKTLLYRTDKTWPSTWFAPIVNGEGVFKDVYSVMANWGSNHGVFVHGHIGHQLITMASMLRIPVNMHNVSEDRIFRPHAWSAFGTKDLESADYRACANYGPIYK